MSALVAVETRRFGYRPAIRALALLALVVAAFTLVGAYVGTRPPSAESQEQGRAAYEAALQDWEVSGDEQVASCEEQQDAARAGGDPAADYGCDDLAPRPEHFQPPVSTFADSVTSWLSAVTVFVLGLGFAAGVTFLTAELGAGSLGLWLTYVPRRGRVYASKVGVAALVVAPTAALVLALTVGGAWAAAALNDAVGTAGSDLWTGLGWRVLRAAVLAGALASAGAALGLLLRNAAAAVGAGVGWLLVVDSLAPGLVPALTPWTLRMNLAAWVEGGTAYSLEVPCGQDQAAVGMVCLADRTVSMTHGAVVSGVVIAVLVAAGAVVFRRRDVE